MAEVSDRVSAALAERYRIERKLGEGGMATVYLAEDLRHRRRVAIKVLHPELSAILGPERFLREIELTASLQHPHILPLFDSGAADGLLYYVMPYVEGETLRSRLARERQLPVAETVRIAADVADALEYAHKHGVIHRDIKPENILLHEGRPQVADFGIALAVQQAGGSRMTHTGMSLGTPQYMSPEQALGERALDARTDIYALGVVSYEMLVGEPPFSGPTPQAIVAKVMTEPPAPITAQRRTVPPHVESAVMTALEKLPADRFATAGEFARALRDGTAAPSTWPSAAPARKWFRPASWLRGGILVLAGAVVGAAILWLARPSKGTGADAAIRFEISADSAQPIELNCCAAIFAVSPDGRTIVFQSREPGDSMHSLYARELSSVGRRPIAGTRGVPRGMFFSPDGAQLGFQTIRSIRTVPLAGGEATTVTQLPPGFYGGGTWTNDGQIIFATRSLYTVPARGGTPQVLLSPDSAQGEREFHMPHFIASANAVLFSVTHERKAPDVRILWLAGKRVKPITLGVTPSYVAAGGWLLVARSTGQLEALPFDPESGDTTGGPVRVADGIELQSPVEAYAEYAASPGGTIVRVASGSRGRGPVLEAVDERGVSEQLLLPIQADHLDQPRISPDGRRLAVLAEDPLTRLHSIFMYDFAARSATRLALAGEHSLMSWTSDGDSLLTATQDGRLTIMPADRAGAEREAGALEGWTGIRSISVRGPWAAFGGTAASGALVDLGIVRRDGATRPRIYASSILGDDDPAISPDGKWLAYDANDTGRQQVYVSALPVASQRIAVSVDGGGEPRWSRDGRVLYYRRNDRIMAATVAPGAQFHISAHREIALLGTLVGRGNWDVDPTRPRVFWVESAIAGRTPLLVELNALPGKSGQ